MLTSAINRHLRSRPRPERQRHCFHCSDLHLPLGRLVSLYLKGPTNHFKPRVLRIFDNGFYLERRLLQYLDEMGILVGSNVPVQDEELELVGEADAVIEFGGRKFVLEVKSCNSKTFSKLKRPPKAQLWQVQGYLHCSGLPEAVIIYESKDCQRLKEFHISLDPSIVAEFTRKIKQAQHMIRRLTNQDTLATATDMMSRRPTIRPPEAKPKKSWEEIKNNQPRGFFAWLKAWGKYFRSAELRT